MECGDIQTKLEAFLDGELTQEEGNAISEHLETCPDCQAELEKLTAVDRLVAQTQGLDPGEASWERMRAGIREGISARPKVSRPGVIEWMRWLLSPRYVVIKVGAALAIVALALMVSRQFSVHRFAPPSQNVPESVVSKRSVVSGGVPESRQPNEIAPSLSAKAGQESVVPGSPERQDTVTRELSNQARRTSVSNPAQVPPSVGHIAPGAVVEKKLQAEAQSKPAPQTTQLAPVIESEQESTSKPQIERSIEVLPESVNSERGAVSVGTGSPVTIMRATPRAEGVDAQRLKDLQAREQTPLAQRMEVITPASHQPDSAASTPFSEKSYWETYGRKLDASVEAKSGLDSLWAEYHLCAGESCQQEVAPYLVEALYFQASKSGNRYDIDVAKRYMTLQPEILRRAWGDERFDVRWGKLLSLEKQ